MLVEVGALGGFSRAARVLRRSQPGVSQGIAALEEEPGVRLVRRARGRVTLTEAGQRVARSRYHLVSRPCRTLQGGRRNDCLPAEPGAR